jgi:DNA-binding CsgD family transcriptional regulator
MAPLLYTEEQLVPAGAAAHHGHAPPLLACLLKTSSFAERQRLVRTTLNAIGFEWMTYVNTAWRHGTPISTRVLTSYANPRWSDIYFGSRYGEIDFRLQKARCSSLPVVWDLCDVASQMSAPNATPRHRAFVEQMDDCGLRSGVLWCVASAIQLEERTMISFSSARPNRKWIGYGVLAQSLMLALCVHELQSVHMRLPGTPGLRPAGSPTRQEILRCVSQGQSVKEIAYRLQLSDHAVKYHLRELRRHFAVNNRLQLISAAAKASEALRA